MSQTTISIRVDQSLKRNFDALCEAFGITTSAAFNIFMKAVVRERRIPFEIKAPTTESVNLKALQAFKVMREIVAESETPYLSLDEINEEINAVRDERK
ncbi:MAG: type II toxin-antitoxin system RelB/DinJ family antitoxin [Muribaculaceae bacterium]|nr:type II toxin-antitoxin system RelB/DinJ family antitoxin [Muribaculaceae bacterium]